MSNLTTLFTGGAGFEVGAMLAGCRGLWGVEIRPDIAAVAERNIPGLRVIVSDVADVDYSSLEKPDHLHASTSCKRASPANSDGEESPEDIAAAQATCRAIEILTPRYFTLENVWAYRNFDSFKLIVGTLTRLGYYVDWWHLNSADYAVPQTRKRLILIARLDRQPRKPAPTHSRNPDPFGLYKPWVGWLESIADLVDDLPDDEFAPWQLARLPAELKESFLAPVNGEGSNGFYGDEPVQTIAANHSASKYRAVLMPGGGNTNFAEASPGRGCRYEDEPSTTVTTVTSGGGSMPRAFIVDGQGAGKPSGLVTTRKEDEPIFAVTDQGKGISRAFVVGSHYGQSNAVKDRAPQVRDENEPYFTVTVSGGTHKDQRALGQGRVVRMTPRCLARFMSIPDSYQLPDSNGLACEIIGNSVPPLLAKAICESLK